MGTEQDWSERLQDIKDRFAIALGRWMKAVTSPDKTANDVRRLKSDMMRLEADGLRLRADYADYVADQAHAEAKAKAPIKPSDYSVPDELPEGGL